MTIAILGAGIAGLATGIALKRRGLEVAVYERHASPTTLGAGVVLCSEIYWAGAAAQSTVDSAKEPVNKRQLVDRFAGWPDSITAIITATPEKSIKTIHVHDQDPIETWHRDNVVLVGDAAHAALPTSGQGACQAMEDAWHFANCLEGSPDSVTKAFTEFTQLRRLKTARITQAARGFARSLFNRDADFCRERNTRSAAADHAAIAQGMARGWSEGLPLGRWS